MEDEKSLSELGSLLEKLEIQPPTTESPAAANSNSGECPVCMLPPTYPVRLEACGHVFCFLCIKGVCLRAPSCPMCRAEIPRDLAYNGVSEEQLLTPLQVKQETKSTNEVHWYYEGEFVFILSLQALNTFGRVQKFFYPKSGPKPACAL